MSNEPRQRALYDEAVATLGPALHRLARSYERDADKRRDLLQEIHLALWRSFARFDGRCSLRTWTYRVAHNVATSLLIARRRLETKELLGLEAMDDAVDEVDPIETIDRRLLLERLYTMIGRLKPVDRQLVLLYLEGLDAQSIAEISALSPANVATKIHRIKKLIARQVHAGGNDVD